jgi:uncharacterized iron-regulated protein
MSLSKYRSNAAQMLCLACLAVLAIGGCSQTQQQEGEQTSDPTPAATTAVSSSTKFSDREIISDFADKVVLPTLEQFSAHAQSLSVAIDAFVKNPTEETMKAAQDEWRTARSSWEQSECFTFGPAESLGYDGALDTWPINEVDLKKAIDSQDQLTAEYIEKLQDSQKGFHVMEYLLFGQENNKKLNQFSKRELEYLQFLGQDFSKVATALVASWKQGVEGQPAYREVLAQAGESSNSSYPTLQAGAEEIVNGLIGSLDEVANEKLGKPFEEKDKTGLESRFSHNTLSDIKHNLQGAQNVYNGSFPDGGTSGESLSYFVNKVNPEVDRKIKAQFEAAKTALEKVPDPLETAITNTSAAESIKTAQQAIDTLYEMVEQEILPMVQS